MPPNIRVRHNLRIPWGQLENDVGTSSGHIGNNLETSWGLLRDNLGLLGTTRDLGANLVTTLGLLWDTSVTIRGLLGDHLGLLGILLGNTWNLLVEYLGGYLGTT